MVEGTAAQADTVLYGAAWPCNDSPGQPASAGPETAEPGSPSPRAVSSISALSTLLSEASGKATWSQDHPPNEPAELCLATSIAPGGQGPAGRHLGTGGCLTAKVTFSARHHSQAVTSALSGSQF